MGIESELLQETGVAANGEVRGNSAAEFVDTSGASMSRGCAPLRRLRVAATQREPHAI